MLKSALGITSTVAANTSKRAMRFASLALFLLMLLSVSCADREDGESQLRKRCTDVREHVVSLRASRLGAPGGNTPLAGQIDKHKDSMRRALGDAYIDRCEKKGPSFADCVLGTSDEGGLGACEKGSK